LIVSMIDCVFVIIISWYVNCLSACRNLIILNLNNNALTNVRGFGTFTQLKILSLAQNQITSLEGLQSCESLERLNVAGNLLPGLKSLSPLLNLINLRSLCLMDRLANLTNPLCNSSSYLQDVKNNLPNLDTLDNEWLGQGFHERLSALENAIEHLENGRGISSSHQKQNPNIIITQANINTDTTTNDSLSSIRAANDEYEQLLKLIDELIVHT